MSLISIIVPAWKEGGNLTRLVENFKGTAGTELVVALSDDDSLTQAPDGGGVKVIRTRRGRAGQMNAGAKAANGDVFLFLHGDTVITRDSLVKVKEALDRTGVSIGAYWLSIDSSALWASLVASAANLRSRFFKLPYGDQALFVKRETFERIGGYEDVPLMEDVLFVKAARAHGKLAIIDERAVTSDRRWRERGFIRNTVRNWSIMLAHMAGAKPETLARWYYSG